MPEILRSTTITVPAQQAWSLVRDFNAMPVWNDTVWVNVFVPSTATTRLGRATLAMDTSFPDGDSARIRVTLPTPATFTLAVRRPWWAGDGFVITVNGTALPQPALNALHDPVAGGRAGRKVVAIADHRAVAWIKYAVFVDIFEGQIACFRVNTFRNIAKEGTERQTFFQNGHILVVAVNPPEVVHIGVLQGCNLVFIEGNIACCA